MLLNDSTKMAMGAISSQRVRSFLTALGIAVGIASVVLLTSIGEGIHKFARQNHYRRYVRRNYQQCATFEHR